MMYSIHLYDDYGFLPITVRAATRERALFLAVRWAARKGWVMQAIVKGWW